jgi:hypothetical protein
VQSPSVQSNSFMPYCRDDSKAGTYALSCCRMHTLCTVAVGKSRHAFSSHHLFHRRPLAASRREQVPFPTCKEYMYGETSESEQVELLKPRSVFDVQNVHASASHLSACMYDVTFRMMFAVSTNALCHNGLSSGRPKPYKSSHYVSQHLAANRTSPSSPRRQARLA